MKYLQFRKQWWKLGCFSINQILSWQPDFNRFNLNNWLKKGYLVKLRKEWYAFSECLEIPDFGQYIANRIYMPSYISLHSALSHYGMIPEAILKVTSVSTRKTTEFKNDFGDYTYQKIKAEMMFGFEPKAMADGRSILFATPEKALLDLLYLYPFYQTEKDMLDLRLDEDFMQEDFNRELFIQYGKETHLPKLIERIHILLNAYNL